jgi:hypothetical protein
MADRAATSTGGIGVCGALGITIVVLKLCGVLDWSWWWVLAPFWAPPVAVLAPLAAILAGAVPGSRGLTSTPATKARATPPTPACRQE